MTAELKTREFKLGDICELEDLIKNGWQVDYRNCGESIKLSENNWLRIYVLISRVKIITLNVTKKLAVVCPCQEIKGVD